MRVRALRGVCVGVGQHLKAGDTCELDYATANFLVHTGAVEIVPDEPAKSEPPAPAKSGKKES